MEKTEVFFLKTPYDNTYLEKGLFNAKNRFFSHKYEENNNLTREDLIVKSIYQKIQLDKIRLGDKFIQKIKRPAAEGKYIYEIPLYFYLNVQGFDDKFILKFAQPEIKHDLKFELVSVSGFTYKIETIIRLNSMTFDQYAIELIKNAKLIVENQIVYMNNHINHVNNLIGKEIQTNYEDWILQKKVFKGNMQQLGVELGVQLT